MYQDGLKNKIGIQCPCCGEFIPISADDEYGHRIDFTTPPFGICQNCSSILIGLINDKRKANDDTIKSLKF